MTVVARLLLCCGTHDTEAGVWLESDLSGTIFFRLLLLLLLLSLLLLAVLSPTGFKQRLLLIVVDVVVAVDSR